jgi:hypothetical protein
VVVGITDDERRGPVGDQLFHLKAIFDHRLARNRQQKKVPHAQGLHLALQRPLFAR